MPVKIASKELVAEWDKILRQEGLGMTRGERTDFLVNAGDNLELIIKYEGFTPFDYTLKHKRANGHSAPGEIERNRQAGIKWWASLSTEAKIRHVLRWRSGLALVNNALEQWRSMTPEKRKRCLSGLSDGRTSAAAKKRLTPELRARISEGVKKYWVARKLKAIETLDGGDF
jgi:hypothetical protein